MADWRLETQLTLSPELFFKIILNGLCGKHNLSVVEKARLQRRCIGTEFIRLLLAHVSTEQLPSKGSLL
jgi:hypothetical protein